MTLALTLLLLKTHAGNFSHHISPKLISNVGTKSISDLGELEKNRAVILPFQQESELHPSKARPTMKLAGSALSRDRGERAAVPQHHNGNVPPAGSATCAYNMASCGMLFQSFHFCCVFTFHKH